jgi:excisionase family DNA binding protein
MGMSQQSTDDGYEPLLTVDELARFLNVSASWVRKGVLERTLPFTKLGRSVRFTADQVAEIVASGERPARHDTARPRRTRSGRCRL